ncbi:MAG: NIPSNAP family protein [Sphingomonas sp.]
MIYELRTYHTLPGRMPALLKRFESRTLGIWERLGIRHLGFWRTTVGASHLELVYILVWESLGERERLWNAFVADPEWQQVVATSEADGPIIANINNSFMTPTNFSSLQ